MVLQTTKMNKKSEQIKGIINSYGNLVTITNYGEKTYNDWGEVIFSEPTSYQEYAVSNSYFSKSYSFESSGNLPDSSVTLVFHKDSQIKPQSEVLIEDKTHKVINIEKLKASEVLLAYQVSLGEK